RFSPPSATSTGGKAEAPKHTNTSNSPSTPTPATASHASATTCSEPASSPAGTPTKTPPTKPDSTCPNSDEYESSRRRETGGGRNGPSECGCHRPTQSSAQNPRIEVDGTSVIGV